MTSTFEQPDTLVEVDHIEVAFGTLQILFGVSLQARAGEVVALLGTNGAGKSTLLRVLAGLLRPAAGRVCLRGDDVTGATACAMVERGVVLVQGGNAVFADLTVGENLDVGCHALDRRLHRERQTRVLDLFPHLASKRRQRAGTMSGGEQQQLAIAKGMLLDPAVLCIDELSLGLAPAVVGNLLEVLGAVRAGGTTLIVVEQSLNVAAALADRAVFLEKGAVKFEGRPAELRDRNDIARAVFLG